MKNFGGMPNMQQLMKQAQKMQKQMEQTQASLAEKEITTTAGGGMIEVTVNAKKEIKAIKLQEEVVDPDDIETLEDLIIAAVNEALRQADEYAQQAMSKVTGGLPTGGLF